MRLSQRAWYYLAVECQAPRAAWPPTRVVITTGTWTASIRGLHRARHRAKHLEVMTEFDVPSPLECSELHE